MYNSSDATSKNSRTVKILLVACIGLILVAALMFAYHREQDRQERTSMLVAALLGDQSAGPSPVSLDTAGPSLVSLDTTDNADVKKVIEAVGRQSTYSARFTLQRSGVVEEWNVSYMNMNDFGSRWKASGALTSRPSGKHIVFSSQSTFTCLQQLQPEKGEWVYHDHTSWLNEENPGALTPPMPMPALRTGSMGWTTDRTIPGSEIMLISETVLSPIESRKLSAEIIRYVLSVDPETWLPDSTEMYLDGDMVARIEYSRYGVADVSGVPGSRAECKDRSL